MRRAKNRIKILKIVIPIALITGLIFYFVPSNSHNISNVFMNNMKALSKKSNSKNVEISYRVDKSIRLKNKLLADVDGLSYILIEDDDDMALLSIVSVKDFNGNGTNEVLVSASPAGNCCPNTLFFYSYVGNGYFARSLDFDHSWGEPEVKKWKDKWSVVVFSSNEGVGQQKLQEARNTYILDELSAVKVATAVKKPLVSLAEMTPSEFNFNKNDEVRKLYFDLDGDGQKDIIEGRLWFRWGSISWIVKFSSGKVVDSSTSCYRVGVSKSKTKGVHDIICGSDIIYKWDGSKYVEVE